jgi:cytochrome c556
MTNLHLTESQARLEVIRTKQAAGEKITAEEVVAVQAVKIRELKTQVRDLTARAERADAELRELRTKLAADAAMRPSIVVLQRMANGLDPFDRGRFQCAVAALPHEMPKLSASVATIFDSGGGIGDRLDAARRRREAAERGIRVIDGEGAPGP